MFRHLPPTACPLALSDLRAGLHAPVRRRPEFQAALASYLGARTCRLASSGRTALFLLLRGLASFTGHPARREILLPAYTCPSLVRVILDLGLEPRLVDISPRSLTFEPERLAAGLNEKTLAVICVHPFGLPQPVADVLSMAHAVGAVVIEDAAQALGARLAGRPVGTMADLGLFSLGPGKPLSTGGGGVMCANSEPYAQLIDQMSAERPPPSGAASRQALLRLTLFNLGFHPRGWWLVTRAGLHRAADNEASWGYALHGLADAQAAVGLNLLPRLDDINRQRREKANRLLVGLEPFDFVKVPQPPPASEPIYLRLPVLVTPAERRERLFQQLLAAGIGVGRMYRQPLSFLFPQLGREPHPGAEQIAQHLLTLPTHHYVTARDMECIIRIFEADRKVS